MSEEYIVEFSGTGRIKGVVGVTILEFGISRLEDGGYDCTMSALWPDGVQKTHVSYGGTPTEAIENIGKTLAKLYDQQQNTANLLGLPDVACV